MHKSPPEIVSPVNPSFVPTEGVCARYSVKRGTVWRWRKDPSIGFPAPVRIGGRAFWYLPDLEAFDQAVRFRAAQ